MAGEQYSMNAPYQPPIGYGMNYYQPTPPQNIQNYQVQMDARLKGLEQRLYGQQPIQQPQSSQQNMSVQHQPMQNQPTPATLFMVSTMEEAQNFAPDFSGTRQVFYIENDPDRLGMKRFDIATGAADFSLYEKIKPQDPASPAEQAQIEPEQEAEGYLTDKDIQPIRCQLSDLSAMCIEIKEKLEGMTSGKLPGVGADDGAAKPADGADRPADTGMVADGGESAGDHKQSAASKSRKSNPVSATREKPSGD